jgi:enoyl-CoA hydratase
VKKLLYEKKGHIARITLNRPDVKNCLDDELNQELAETWRAFESDDDLQVAILTGNGDSFCAGADLKTYIPKWLSKGPRDVRLNAATGIGGGITRGQHRLKKPVIAAINGWALAGGFELALACDIRIASEKAVFGSFEIKRGFHHGDGGIVRLVLSAGMATALDLVLTGREVAADEALRLGLVSKVVPHNSLLEEADVWAKRILENSQCAIQSAKETIFDVVGRSFDEALKLEAIYGYSSADTEDTKRRLQGFYEKR